MIPEHRALWEMARHCATWWKVKEPLPPAKMKSHIVLAYCEGDLEIEEAQALMNIMKLKEA
jgi:hypothetical protein